MKRQQIDHTIRFNRKGQAFQYGRQIAWPQPSNVVPVTIGVGDEDPLDQPIQLTPLGQAALSLHGLGYNVGLD